jgi:uncharacterized protein with HEPN domain
MADVSERDAAFLLDMLFAAHDALEFADGLTKERLLSSRQHQNAFTASLPRSRDRASIRIHLANSGAP